MKEYLVDVPVLLIFFARPKQFSKVFEQVKKARSSKLFLYQDGPRMENPDDLKGIAECREIAENIDWECEIHKFYQKKNFGCDPSEYIAQKWVFSYVDRCIVLEDDDVPAISFFTFCKELLDKYEHDTRIGLISGFNHEEITRNIKEDYFFTSNVSIWGWASWRRVIDQWDGKYNFLNDADVIRRLSDIIKHRKYIKNFVSMCFQHKKTGKEHYESILMANHWLNGYLAIVPTKNMIVNIGANADSTHFNGDVYCQPKGLRKIFMMDKYELSSKLMHPQYVNENFDYKDRVYRIMGWGHPIVKLYRTIEELYYFVLNGNIKTAYDCIKEKVQKLINRQFY